MDKQQPIINKVAQSGLITLNLEKYLPQTAVLGLDLEPFLFKGLLLREKDFRQSMKEYDWTQYQGKNLAVYCSTDAIIPVWAYMLIATYVEPYAEFVGFGEVEVVTDFLLRQNLAKINVEDFVEERVIIKGCGDKAVSPAAYLEISRLLKPVVKSLMYGEACSTVPIFKKKISPKN